MNKEQVCSTSDRNDNVEALLSRLTLKEKIALTHGDFTSGGVPRLGISPLLAADGPVGIRLPGHKSKPATEADTAGLDMEPIEATPDMSLSDRHRACSASSSSRESDL